MSKKLASDAELRERAERVLGDALLTPKEVAAAKRQSVSSLWREIARGEFPKPITVSANKRLWRASVVREWLCHREIGLPPERG